MRVMFVGDINLGEYYTAFGHGPRTYLQKGDIFSGVHEALSKADIVVGNLEAAISDYNFNPKRFESSVLRGKPDHAKYLKLAGFKVLQVANNHTVQHGITAFNETIKHLKHLDIEPIGIKNQGLTTIKIGSQNVGFLAASDVPDNTDKNQSSYQRLTDDFIEKAIAAVSRVDHLFVMLHWGLESSTKTLPYQKKIIEKLVASGVRGIIGAHPHLFYEIWKQENSIVAPSLGNFVFDLFWDPRLLATGILDIELSKEKITECRVWPTTISEDGGRPILSAPPKKIDHHLKLYDLGCDMSGEQKRKLLRLIKDLPKGNKTLKLKFIFKKLIGKI